MRLVILGPPGAGKGTQASLLAEHWDVPHLATGNMLREEAQTGTPLGLEAKKHMDRGDLVPDEVMIAMIADRLTRSPAGGFVLDGYPRTPQQADALGEMLDRAGTPIEAVIYITAPEDELIRRMTGRRICPVCQRSYHLTSNVPRHDEVCDDDGTPLITRADDEIDTFRRRIDTYHRETESLATYYDERSVLVRVDGLGAVDEVAERIDKALAGL